MKSDLRVARISSNTALTFGPAATSSSLQSFTVTNLNSSIARTYSFVHFIYSLCSLSINPLSLVPLSLPLRISIQTLLQFTLRLCMSLQRSLSNPMPVLQIVMLHALPRSVKVPQLRLRLGIPILGSPLKPRSSLCITLRSAGPKVIKFRQLLFRLSIVLLRRQPIPMRSLSIVLRYSLAFAIHQA